MPVLRNGRHENFAQQIAAGKNTTDAYLLAGYKSSQLKARQHGYRLRTREDITARIQELIDKPQGRIATQQIVEATRTGRPTIYRPELATLARKLALLGATDQEMADALGIDQGTLEGGPVIVPHQEHLPPDVGAAKLWLSRRRPDLWREKQQIDITGTVAHQIAQMTPDERAQDALDLGARARARLAEWRATIEHEPAPEAPEDEK